MPVYIHDIASSVPEGFSPQQEIRETMKHYLGKDRKTQAIIHRIYSQSGIEKRHSVVEDFHTGKDGVLFLNGTQTRVAPSTGTRNDLYKEKASSLFVETGRKLLDRNPHIDKSDITHVITVSCTGFYAPGPDYDVVRKLDLDPRTQRFHVGFMGCYAAFPALKMAHSFCISDPDAVILMICTELCTLHFQDKNDVDNLLSGSVFADGSAGVLISAQQPIKKAFALEGFASSLTSQGERDMAWEIGDTGFDMVLSSYVPDIIKAELSDTIVSLLKKYSLNSGDIDYWAIHPGGRSIVDKIAQELELTEEQVQASRQVLANYGNMSSPTVLFVLQELLEQQPASGQHILPMAFGPGLTIESGLITVH